MRKAILGSFVGVLAAFAMIVACGGSGGGGGEALVMDQDLLAIAQVDGHSSTPVVNRFMNNIGGTVTVTRESEGHYLVDFGFDVSGRLCMACAGTTDCGSRRTRVVTAGCKVGAPNAVWVTIYDPIGTALTDNGNFVVAVY